MSTVQTTIDDRSQQIRYTGDWESLGGPFEYMQTTHGTHTPGAQATITFSGTSIAVYGTISVPSSNTSVIPVSTYSIDGGPPVSFTSTPHSEDVYGQLFYQSPPLQASKSHTLVITLAENSDGNNFWLDYFEVALDPPTSQSSISVQPPPSPSLSPETTRSAAAPSVNSPTPTPSPSPSPSPAPSRSISGSNTNVIVETVTQITAGSTSGTSQGIPLSAEDASTTSETTPSSTAISNKSTFPPGAIAGVTIGVVALISLLALLLLCLLRRRRRRAERYQSAGDISFWNAEPSTTAGARTTSTPFTGQYVSTTDTTSVRSRPMVERGAGYTIQGGTTAEKTPGGPLRRGSYSDTPDSSDGALSTADGESTGFIGRAERVTLSEAPPAYR